MQATTAGLTAVWIDDAQAVIVRWDGRASVRRVTSDIPAHHRSTGHVRHDPTFRHGGGGIPDDTFERDRAGHLREFLEAVVAAVPPDGDVEILGPGTVRAHLARTLAEADHHRGRTRAIRATPSGPLTDRQLIAWLRLQAGDPPRRRGIEPEP